MSKDQQPLGKLFSRLRQPYRAVASVAVVRDGKLLLVREAEGGWNLPGGRLRPSESATDAAVREAKEETGLDATLEDVAGVYRYVSRSGRPRVRYVFRARAAGELSWDGEEIAEARWMPLAEVAALPDKQLAKPALLRQIVRDIVDGRRRSIRELEHVEPTAIAA